MASTLQEKVIFVAPHVARGPAELVRNLSVEQGEQSGTVRQCLALTFLRL